MKLWNGLIAVVVVLCVIGICQATTPGMFAASDAIADFDPLNVDLMPGESPKVQGVNDGSYRSISPKGASGVRQGEIELTPELRQKLHPEPIFDEQVSKSNAPSMFEAASGLEAVESTHYVIYDEPPTFEVVESSDMCVDGSCAPASGTVVRGPVRRVLMVRPFRRVFRGRLLRRGACGSCG